MPSSLIYANQPSGHQIAQVTHCLYCPTWLQTERWVPTLGHFHQLFSQFWHECFWKVYLLRIVGCPREKSLWFYRLFYGPPISPCRLKRSKKRLEVNLFGRHSGAFWTTPLPCSFSREFMYAFNILFPLEMSGQRFTEQRYPAIWQLHSDVSDLQ